MVIGGSVDAKAIRRIRSWFLQGDAVAKDGVFTREGQTPLESVMNANVFDVLEYMERKVLANVRD